MTQWLVVGLLGLLALLVLRVSLEASRRPALEHVVALTAVGDVRYYALPTPEPAIPVAVASLNGRPLLPVSYRRLELRDSRLALAGEDDSHAYRLYTTGESVSFRGAETERKGAPVLFIKIGPNEFLRVQPAP